MLVAIAIPLFDSLAPGIEIAERTRQVNPSAHVTFFGQYATINYARLVARYSDSCIVGEWEEPLVALAARVGGDADRAVPGLVEANRSVACSPARPYMPRDKFRVPTRDLLPPLHKYPQAGVTKLCGSDRVVGATEITRGCHHRCLYCSVFAAYDGKVLVVPEELVEADVGNLVAQGANHITFIDAEFFNTKYHGLKILRKLHAAFPGLTYDFTTRIDHLLENKESLREMRSFGVRFITSALEFPSDTVLEAIHKEFRAADIEEAIAFMDDVGIRLNPSFIVFNPWIRLEDLVRFPDFVRRNGLDDIIDPIQYETRLHLYRGSPLLQTPSIRALELTEQEFQFEWKHPDRRVDELYREMMTPPEPGVFKRCCLKC
jgi:radical SAM superfamily enzyme YgiQ (UPF0313 family)